MTLDRERLTAININGLDAILVFMNLTIEIVGAVSSTGDADEIVIDIANRLVGFAS